MSVILDTVGTVTVIHINDKFIDSMEGKLKLAGVSKPVQTLRFNRILDIYPTLEEALKSFKAP